MPFYEYACHVCKITYDVLKPMSQCGINEPCPRCQKEGDRIFSLIAVTNSKKKSMGSDEVNWDVDDKREVFRKQLAGYEKAGGFEKLAKDGKMNMTQISQVKNHMKKKMEATLPELQSVSDARINENKKKAEAV